MTRRQDDDYANSDASHREEQQTLARWRGFSHRWVLRPPPIARSLSLHDEPSQRTQQRKPRDKGDCRRCVAFRASSLVLRDQCMVPDLPHVKPEREGDHHRRDAVTETMNGHQDLSPLATASTNSRTTSKSQSMR